MSTGSPDDTLARKLAARATRCEPIAVNRFGTGTHHFVFEAAFRRRAPVVVRIAADHDRRVMIGAAALSRRLRPLGVPLPHLISDGSRGPHSHLVLERLPGTDLGNVVHALSGSSLESIAAEVARAQEITSKTGSAGRYGYAVTPADAPRERWSQVLFDNLARSRRRMEAAGLFELAAVDTLEDLLRSARHELDVLAAVPFLHDTTTKNVIVTPEGGFSGIVDVDDLCFGDPRYVPALTLASLMASGGPTRYVDAWMSAAGFQADRLFRLYVTLFVVDFMSEHGQVLNGNSGPSSPEQRMKLIRLFATCCADLRPMIVARPRRGSRDDAPGDSAAAGGD
jgi:aminoglycoside phosphotransferase